MKPTAGLLVMMVLLMLCGCAGEKAPSQTTPETTETTIFTTAATQETTLPPLTVPTLPTLPTYVFTEEEQQMLLKIGMAELGDGECTECIALVMRTILNRVESGRFGRSIRSVLFAQDQFTPVSDGTYDKAVPNQLCYDALDLITSGWDESQGALYYEFCEGESWHSKNLNLLFQHCKTRFYN